jgi:hypothetical protein
MIAIDRCPDRKAGHNLAFRRDRADLGGDLLEDRLERALAVAHEYDSPAHSSVREVENILDQCLRAIDARTQCTSCRWVRPLSAA